MSLRFLRPQALLRLVTIFASVASLVSLAFLFHQPGSALTAWEIFIIIVACIFTAGLLVLELREISQIKVFALSDEKGIRNYMYKWISEGGSVLIFSRDMSWVRDKQMEDMLYSKARRNELSICLPEQIHLSRSLEEQGAHVIVYPELHHTPQSRFTIANHTSGDSRIAIGRRSGDHHVIEEFAAGDHPAFYIGRDLAEVLRKYHEFSGR